MEEPQICRAYYEGYVECLSGPRDPVALRDLISPGGIPALLFVLLMGWGLYCYWKGGDR